MSDIETLARRFADAGSELGLALVAQLEQSDPELTAKVAQALESGERLAVTLELALDDSCIRLESLDDYEGRKRIMTIAAKIGGRH